MRRVALTWVLACAALTVLGGDLALSAKAPRRSDAKARLTACHPALDPASRSLTVDASMKSLQKGDRMQLRFDLYQKPVGATRFHKLAGPGLGAWNPASPGVDRFRYRKPIQNLPPRATYFVKVTFRWLDDTDVVHARTSRSTGLCFQPDLRPDLRISGFQGTRRIAQGEFGYKVVLRNAGRTASRDFVAVLSINGLPQPGASVAGMQPGERRVVELRGPRCDAGQTARVELDPDNRVDEAVETNNSRSTTC